MSQSHLRIPFALRRADQVLVGPDEVSRGAACGCICPSCKLPLVANQGDQNAWHFSHNSRGHDREVAQQCEYSFYVSISAMTKQLLRDALDLDVPTYISTVNYPLGVVGALTREFEVTPKQTLSPTRVDVDAEVNGMTCDAVLWLGEYRLVLFLTHKDKPLPQISGWSLKDLRTGVMEIDLTAVEKSYGGLKAGDAFKASIGEFLQKNLDSKRWIYHPREERLKQGLLEQLEQEWNNQRSRNLGHSQSTQASRSAVYSTSKDVAALRAKDLAQAERKVLYSCRLCGQEFVGILPGTPSCPRCRKSASLFAVELKTLE